MEPTEYDVFTLLPIKDLADSSYETTAERTAWELSAGDSCNRPAFSETAFLDLSSPASDCLSPELLYSKEMLWADAKSETSTAAAERRSFFIL